MEEKSLKEKYVESNRRNPFVIRNGVEVEDVFPDRAILRLTIGPDSMNLHGFVHGGALFTLADNAAGSAASTDGRFYVTQASDIHFLRTQGEGVARAEAHVRHRGKSTVLVDVSITGDDDKLLATASFSFFCLDGSETARSSLAARQP